MKNQTLSVTISNYNHAEYIAEAIQSILDQSYKPHEIIIIDDCSTDNSVEIIEKFMQIEPRIRLIRNKRNMGVNYNTNSLIRMATGDCWYGLGADDKVLPGFLEKSMSMLSRYLQAGLCSSLSLLINEKGVEKGVFTTPVISWKECYIPPEKTRNLLCKYSNWLQGNATIYRRKALLEIGGFNPELRAFSDGFISRVIVLKYGACFIPEALVAWRQMRDGYSSMTYRNPKTAIEVINCAKKMMQTTYRDLFPPKYSGHWEKLQFYWMGIANLQTLKRQQEMFVDYMNQIMRKQNLIDKGFILLLVFSMQLQSLFTKLYLIMRNFTWSSARGLISSYIYRLVSNVGFTGTFKKYR